MDDPVLATLPIARNDQFWLDRNERARKAAEEQAATISAQCKYIF